MHDSKSSSTPSKNNPTTEIDETFYPPASLLKEAHIRGLEEYQELYRESIMHTNKFWREIAHQLYFKKDSKKGLEWNFDYRKGEVFVRFMSGAYTNIAYNCLERNIEKGYANKVAYYLEGNNPDNHGKITYKELLSQVINFSAILLSKNVQKGDVVAIYLPMIVELPIAMLACARIGAIHTVIFAGFSATSLARRIIQCKACLLITADGYFRGTKFIPLKACADEAIQLCAQAGASVKHVILVEHLKRISPPQEGHAIPIPYNEKIDCLYEEEIKKTQHMDAPVVWVEAEEPLFILYTSGSTGTPKGIVHTTAGYMTYSFYTTHLSLDTHAGKDTLWTTADCGWITGHTYVVYGPLLNGLTSILFEGTPTYPTPSRIWSIVEQYQVTQLYTAPTIVRTLMSYGEEWVKKHTQSSLKIIGIVGEPIDPPAWKWLFNVVGEKRCAIIDTYWQTETGGHVITALPGAIPTKPASATLPFPGIIPIIINEDGLPVEGTGVGKLCFKQPWPGMMRTLWGDHSRYVQIYFEPCPGYYFTGDGARRDGDGYYWIRGRIDDLLKVSGCLLSTAEIEAALTSHTEVIEAAVVAAPHPIKGNFPYVFVTLRQPGKLDKAMFLQLQHIVREKVSPIAMPHIIQEASNLPKTRSGKIMRRILRKIVEGNRATDLGDITTLINEEVIETLWEERNHAISTQS